MRKLTELCDAVSVVMVCLSDNTILTVFDGSEYWLPSGKVIAGVNLQFEIAAEIKEVAGWELQPDRVIRVYKVWVPFHPSNAIYHTVVAVKVTPEQKKKLKINTGKYRGKVKWQTDTDLVKLQNADLLRSPEIIEFFNLARNKVVNTVTELFFCGNMCELNENILITFSTHMYDQVITSADFNLEVQKELLCHFLLLCFPAMYMGKVAFTKFMQMCGWSRQDVPNLFRAANLTNCSGLTFREFMYMIAAMEPKTSHGGLSAEIRCRYIFRFFDQDNDNLLNSAEFKSMVIYMRKSKGQSLDTNSVSNDVESYYRAFGFSDDGKPLTMGEFLHSVGDLKMRGTSLILRSPEAVRAILAKNSVLSDSPKVAIDVSKGLNAFRKSAEEKTFELGIHTIKLQKNGTVINVEQIWNVEAAVSNTTLKNMGAIESKRKNSVEVFSQKSIANEVLKTLRTLSMINRSSTNFAWGNVDSSNFAHNLITIAKQVKDIMKNESRLVEISSPTYILGDFHGNFADMINFEKVFWHLGPNLCPSNLLFLGDYVDRGLYGVEVVMYLFCYKVQAPEKITLIRGNHEIRDIQKMFTFYAECLSKFGDKLGEDVWNHINIAFDHMPLAAIIDGKLFCCHGGIPPPWLCPAVAAINQIPCPLPRPDSQSTLAWELMWNDPVRSKQINDSLSMELLANEGFANNQRRGTAHVFSLDALDRFLNSNGFTYLIRGHESAQAGFNLQQKGKALTVFSSSKYCNGSNEAACILADQGKLRILRLET